MASLRNRAITAIAYTFRPPADDPAEAAFRARALEAIRAVVNAHDCDARACAAATDAANLVLLEGCLREAAALIPIEELKAADLEGAAFFALCEMGVIS